MVYSFVYEYVSVWACVCVWMCVEGNEENFQWCIVDNLFSRASNFEYVG